MAKQYTFNRPIFALILVPLLLMMAMLLYGVVKEINFLVVLMLLVTLLFMAPIIYLSFLRRLKIDADQAEWITPSFRRSIPLEEIKHFGVIKYRSFRFIFVSRAEEVPFKGPNPKVAPDENTFLVQYRKGAWNFVKEKIHAHHPDLKPHNLVQP